MVCMLVYLRMYVGVCKNVCICLYVNVYVYVCQYDTDVSYMCDCALYISRRAWQPERSGS